MVSKDAANSEGRSTLTGPPAFPESSAMSRLACPACRATLEIDSSNAGRRIACPSCNAPIRLPNHKRAAPAPEPEPELAPAPARSGALVALHIVSDVGSLVVWGMLIAWSALWLVVLWSDLAKADNAIKEAGASAQCAAFVVIGYAMARGVEVLLGRLAAWTQQR